MAASGCKCVGGGTACQCVIQAGDGMLIGGDGSKAIPFTVSVNPFGDPGESPVRERISFTTANLAVNATESGEIVIGRSYRLLRVSTTAPSRVRLYVNYQQAYADISRPIGTNPTGNHGVLLDYVTTDLLLSCGMYPARDCFTTDPNGANTKYVAYNLTNTSTTPHTITVDLDLIVTEAYTPYP